MSFQNSGMFTFQRADPISWGISVVFWSVQVSELHAVSSVHRLDDCTSQPAGRQTSTVDTWCKLRSANSLTIHTTSEKHELKKRHTSHWCGYFKYLHRWATWIVKINMNRCMQQKLTVPQTVKFPAYYGTRRFTTMFTTTCHFSCPEPDTPSPRHPILFL